MLWRCSRPPMMLTVKEYGHGTFARFVPPSPVQHFWSLAVEEQFYLLLPLIAIVPVGLSNVTDSPAVPATVIWPPLAEIVIVPAVV